MGQVPWYRVGYGAINGVPAAADFSRIRNASLGRFTVDRLVTVLNRLGARIEMTIKVRSAAKTKRKVA